MAVVVRGNKLLVVPEPEGRYAVMPEVVLLPGETPEQAVLRELADQWSLHGTAVRRLFERDQDGGRASYVLVHEPDGEPEGDARPVLWATPGEFPLLGLLPEGIGDLVTDAAWPLRIEEAGAGEWPVLERLWQLYQHDLSEFWHSAPDAEGLFRGRLAGYAGGGRGDRVAYLARLGDLPCGFALVRGVGRDQRLMGEFFVTRATRGRGTAAAFAREVFARHPGPWAVPFQNENPRAAAFWRRLTADVLDDVTETSFPVPGKPHLPPDVWLTGTQR